MSSQGLNYTASEAVLAEIAALRAENAKLKASAPVKSLSLKVSAKGAISVYGMGRFPVTLYAEQWTKLIGQAETIQAFIKANQAKLSVKGDKLTPELGEQADQASIQEGF